MIRLLAPRDYRVMPWKNGGGTTTEIWIHPEGAGWDDFAWRVGIADIGRSGAFSSFPGIDRSIMLLECPEGSGMKLTIDGNESMLPRHRFVDFPGEAVTEGTLLGAPVRDFNVMSRRATVRHACGFATLEAGEHLKLARGLANFAYLARGALTLDVGEPGQTIDAGMSVVRIGAPLTLSANAAGAQLIWAGFDPDD